jgi:hypothetical protein
MNHLLKNLNDLNNRHLFLNIIFRNNHIHERKEKMNKLYQYSLIPIKRNT